MEHISWVIVCVAVLGTILNANKRREGFYFWIFANIGWIIINLQHKIYSQAFLFFFYTCLCFYGIYKWKE